MPLDKITRKDVKNFIIQKMRERLSTATVRNLKAYLGAILSEAVDDEIILANPIFYKAIEKAQMRQIRIHDLRHTYATLRISKGDNILDVSKQLGHHSAKITLDIYAHWMPGTKKAEVDELDLTSEPDRNGASIGNEGTSKRV